MKPGKSANESSDQRWKNELYNLSCIPATKKSNRKFEFNRSIGLNEFHPVLEKPIWMLHNEWLAERSATPEGGVEFLFWENQFRNDLINV